jgi:biopolymer transport protein ExbD
MKSAIGVCLLVLAMASVAMAQEDHTKPVLRHGVNVEMPVSDQAVEMRAADAENATVVSLTADGRLFVGVRPVELSDLGRLNAETVYVKADARAPYQKVLAVLDTLHGHSVVLLTAPPPNAKRTSIMPPYGVKFNRQ